MDSERPERQPNATVPFEHDDWAKFFGQACGVLCDSNLPAAVGISVSVRLGDRPDRARALWRIGRDVASRRGLHPSAHVSGETLFVNFRRQSVAMPGEPNR